jgi:hypothetical protein
MADHGDAVGVRHYECIESDRRKIANRLLRLMRGTARPVDAVEIFELGEAAVTASLAEKATRELWRKMLSCRPHGFDPERSFVLMGRPRELVSGNPGGQRVLWFGRGHPEFGDAEFVAHYTGRHGPLVARNAQLLGINRYRQVASERSDAGNVLRELGLGRAAPPPVFAELVMSAPSLDLSSLRARRQASRAIKADEKRHIDFHRSMLILG